MNFFYGIAVYDLYLHLKRANCSELLNHFFLYKNSQFMVFGMDTAIAYGGTLIVLMLIV